jgi:hypothetical protein
VWARRALSHQKRRFPARAVADAELRKMEAGLKSLFHFNPVNPTGRYQLELGHRSDRKVICKLAEICAEQSAHRQSNDLIDTSEKGDWEGWRGEHLDGRPAFDEGLLSLLLPRSCLY